MTISRRSRDRRGEGEICLILDEVRGETNGFWPVMSFLTKEEAGELCKELARYAAF